MRVRISRAINHYLLKGKKGVMVSSRVYIEDRYGWQLCIDWWFYFLKGERGHCHNCFKWEYGGGHEAQEETHQVRSEKAEGETTGH